MCFIHGLLCPVEIPLFSVQICYPDSCFSNELHSSQMTFDDAVVVFVFRGGNLKAQFANLSSFEADCLTYELTRG